MSESAGRTEHGTAQEIVLEVGTLHCTLQLRTWPHMNAARYGKVPC